MHLGFLVDVWHWLTSGDQWHGGDGIPHLLANHVRVSIASLLVATLIAVPLGAWLGHRRVGGVVAINIANIGRAIPIYAMLVLAVQIFGISNPVGFGWTGSFVAFVPLVLLGIPPMLTNSYIGVRDVGDELVDAARGMGLSEREILRRVEVPVALPLIMAGIRTAMVGIVATATLASFTGVDTLATPIFIGLRTDDNVAVFGGAVLVALLAIVADLALAGLQRSIVSPGLRSRSGRGKRVAT
ncbi:MAG: osmoprotectant transport system permease protein [Actinomycetota bacterium]|nr:osmoprotectant transport system permease protein [Actinomycetota bacterium]